MSFGLPLAFLALIPWTALILWRLRGGGRPVVEVATFALWRAALEGEEVAAPARRRRLPPRVLVEAAIGLLAILAAASPRLVHEPTSVPLRVVLDDGAAMRTAARAAAATRVLSEHARALGLRPDEVPVTRVGGDGFSTAGRDFGRDLLGAGPAERRLVIADDLSGLRAAPAGTEFAVVDVPIDNVGIVGAAFERDGDGGAELVVAIAATRGHPAPALVVRDADGRVGPAVATGLDATGRGEARVPLAGLRPPVTLRLEPGGDVPDDDVLVAGPSRVTAWVATGHPAWRDALEALGYLVAPAGEAPPPDADLVVGDLATAPDGAAVVVLFRGRSARPSGADVVARGPMTFPAAGLDVPTPPPFDDVVLAVPRAPDPEVLAAIGGLPAIWMEGGRVAVGFDVEASGLADRAAFAPLVAALVRRAGAPEPAPAVMRDEREILGRVAPAPPHVTRPPAPVRTHEARELAPLLAAAALVLLAGLRVASALRARRATRSPGDGTMSAPSVRWGGGGRR